MASAEPDKYVKLWMKRIKAADKAREAWESRYEVVRCREYWCGMQREDPGDDGDRKAIINLIQPTLRTKIPGLFFYHPFARIEASPAKTDTPGTVIEQSAKLIQDTANTIIRDKQTGLMENVEIGIKESYWAFACAEVGYSAEFTDNPALKDNAPPLKEEKDTEGVEGVVRPEPILTADVNSPEPIAQNPEYDQIVSDECFWVRRIPARQVLCSAPESTRVEENDWIGYWEYMKVEDVKKAPAYSNTRDLKGSSKKDDDGQETSADEVKVYKIWDMRAKKRYVFAEGHKSCLLKEDCRRRKLFFLRQETEPDRFRPIPPIYGWLGLQDQTNDTEEALRLDVKTRVRRYTVDPNGIEPGELEKFEANDPNVWIKRSGNSVDPITPVNQPVFSGELMGMVQHVRANFDQVTGVGAEARQQASSDTATQAAIMNQRQNINDTYDRNLVATWLAEIVEELVQLAIEKMTLPKWIQMNTDPYSPMAQQDAMVIAQQWQQITAGQLERASGAIRWNVTIDIESLSPVSAQERQQEWNQTLALISNPAVAPLLALSPELLKITLDKNQVKNAREQEAIRMALMQNAQMQMQMAAMKAAPAGAPMPPGPGGPGGAPAPPGPPQMIPGPSEGMVQ